MRLWFVLGILAILGGCAAVNSPYAPEEVVREKAYRHTEPASITLITVVNNQTGSGGHTALMINASQRVLFDPAGSFHHEIVPEQNDVLYGITPRVLAGYKSAHARSTFHVVTQTVPVTPEQAEIALRLAQQNGAVPRSFCTSATSGLLRKVPGFENTKSVLFPINLMKQFAQRPGVVTDKYFEDDEGTIVDGIENLQL
ncbi:MAG: hypothetical protein ABJM43_23225 [Paracoccaceae bacterium]